MQLCTAQIEIASKKVFESGETSTQYDTDAKNTDTRLTRAQQISTKPEYILERNLNLLCAQLRLRSRLGQCAS